MTFPITLIPEVEELASRLGAQAQTGRRSRFRQAGSLRNPGDQRWMKFKARQWIASDMLAFRWQARVGPLGLVQVEDALAGDLPVGRARVLGLFPLSSAEPSPPLIKGELQRYLAELPWNPDAIVSNPFLFWKAGPAGVLTVSARIGAIEASVDLHLGENGLPMHTFALRPAMERNAFVEREWFGGFSDYREASGRLIPHEGRVAWKYGDDRIDVWHGTITDWSVSDVT